eukprot:7832868-Pyramimonas_sp.AAC.1
MLKQGFGLDLGSLKCSGDFILRPLLPREERVSLGDRTWGAKDRPAGQARPELPPDQEPSPAIAAMRTDQGSTGASALSFLMFGLG